MTNGAKLDVFNPGRVGGGKTEKKTDTRTELRFIYLMSLLHHAAPKTELDLLCLLYVVLFFKTTALFRKTKQVLLNC